MHKTHSLSLNHPLMSLRKRRSRVFTKMGYREISEMKITSIISKILQKIINLKTKRSLKRRKKSRVSMTEMGSMNKRQALETNRMLHLPPLALLILQVIIVILDHPDSVKRAP